MPQWVEQIFLPQEHPGIAASMVLIFMVLFLGILLGKLKIMKVSLGISGIVFVGILSGHLGYKVHAETQEFLRDFGLILFVYAIGMQVGPSFFSRLKQDGLLYNSLAIGTVLLGALVTYLLFVFTGSGMDNMIGMMAGAVTNTPSLGAAKAALKDIAIQAPDKIWNDPTNAYAITYPFGIIGIILVMIFAKHLFKIDVKNEITLFNEQIKKKHPAPEVKKCRLTNSAYFGKTLKDAIGDNKIIVSRIKHSGSTVVQSPNSEYILKERDVLMLVGLPQDLDIMINLLGYQSTDNFIESQDFTLTKSFIVTRSEVINKTIGQLNFLGAFNSRVTRVYRTGLELLANDELVLHYGDKLRVVGAEKDLIQIEKLVGNSEKRLQEPQLLSIFLGIILGVFVGSIPFFLPGLSVPVKLGMAAGPLLVAILISRFGGISSLHSYLQQSALLFMKDFGISLFFASIGIHAGETFYHTFITYNGWVWVLYGLIITITPILVMLIIARYVFKLNFMPLLGLIAGSYTDPAALDFSTNYYKSDLPLQAYATVYPLVTITRIVIAQILVLYFALS
ncbi:MAG: putative transporter [Bacteroidia bacterium]